MIKRNFRITVVFLFGLCLGGCNAPQKYSSADSEGWVTLSSLMDEMGDPQADACFPEPYYEARQLTSYDRRSLLPGTPWWHANDDWAGFERYEANDGRVERVLFDEQGPGAITRIITTGGAGTANLRFYFDGEQHPSIVIPSFDISKFPVEIPSGMIYMHEHYPRFQGASFYYPIPYARRCKITVDDLNRGYVYHVNYRTYAPGTKVRTFTVEEARKLRAKAAEAGRRLENPVSCAENGIQTEGTLPAGGKLGLDLPAGENAVRTLMVDIGGFTPGTYGQLMRGIIVRMDFDGTQTVRVPLSDLSGAGMGAPRVDNYYMAADGQGRVILRFVMPYRSSARVELENITSYDAKATLSANVSPWKWYDNTLYFHASWRQENGLETNKGLDYDMASLSGRGVFKGDVLSLYNWCPRWYGEGDEHIWVDGESFPSHFGCGTEDYYNTTYARRCKITVDDLNRGYVYHVNYRTYAPGTKVRTFTVEEARKLRAKAAEAGRRLENPVSCAENGIQTEGTLPAGGKLGLDLPAGENAVRTLMVDIGGFTPGTYGQLMRGIIVRMDFDGTQTVRVPLSDLSGAGMGAPRVDNYYMAADGQGRVILRFVMPYRSSARVELENITSYDAKATLSANVSPWKWYDNTLYFHASWRQENGLETNKGLDYDMASLSGRGVFKGDVLSLYNWCPRWYGEGDEHIWVDGESFPSHFGCGTEDYYNTTYAPIHVYHFPFGGAPREDDEASRGYNTFVRVRGLDAIPFDKSLKFEFELISWDGGKVDYSSTVFWYGNLTSAALTASADEAALYSLPEPIYTNNK